MARRKKGVGEIRHAKAREKRLYREDDAIRAGVKEAEEVKEISNEVRDGAKLWFKKNPRMLEAFLLLGLS